MEGGEEDLVKQRKSVIISYWYRGVVKNKKNIKIKNLGALKTQDLTTTSIKSSNNLSWAKRDN